jgi:glycosyltransferase involved in cell wall biosynthesis
MKVTVGIKALNEEKHIEASILGAIEAVAPFGGEVVLADSGSSDRTIQIASRHPIRIVQLANLEERSCGAGAQLAYQHARGDYFYMLDGDMVLDPSFIAAGIAFLEANPDVAGVGGHVREMETQAHEFQVRAKLLESGKNWRPGIVDQLDCGGLYRRSAIQEAGYFADRNLRGFEEFDLAARLKAKGWKLARIDHMAVEHYGHVMAGYSLLWKRLRSGYLGSAGQVLRGAIGQDHLMVVLRKLGHLRNYSVIMVWWATLLAALLSPLVWIDKLGLLVLLLLLPLLFLSIRRRSFKLGLFALASWNSGAIGSLLGLFRERVPPRLPLAAVTIRSRAEA